MLFGLEDNNIEEVRAVFRKFSTIDAVILYGSRVKGNFKAGSDIDVTLVGEHISYKDLVNISFCFLSVKK